MSNVFRDGVKGSFQTDYPVNQEKRGYPGQFIEVIRSEALTNSNGETAKVVSIAYTDTSAAAASEVLTIDGVEISFTASTAGTATATAAKTAIDAEFKINQTLASVAVSDSTVTLTGRYGGDDFSISLDTTETGTLTVDTAAASTSAIDYGLFVRRVGEKFALPSSGAHVGAFQTLGLLGGSAIQDNESLQVERFKAGVMLKEVLA